MSLMAKSSVGRGGAAAPTAPAGRGGPASHTVSRLTCPLPPRPHHLLPERWVLPRLCARSIPGRANGSLPTTLCCGEYHPISQMWKLRLGEGNPGPKLHADLGPRENANVGLWLQSQCLPQLRAAPPLFSYRPHSRPCPRTQCPGRLRAGLKGLCSPCTAPLAPAALPKEDGAGGPPVSSALGPILSAASDAGQTGGSCSPGPVGGHGC